MAEICTCGGRLGNTGIDNCVIEFRATNNYIITPMFKGDGTKNYIDISVPASVGAAVLLKTQATTTALERLYPLPSVDEVNREKGERVTQTPASGNIYKVKDGIRVNEMEFFGQNASFSFMRELALFGCTRLAYYAVDISGTMEGYVSEDEPTKFYPLPMMKNSFDQMYKYATFTTIQSLMLYFNLQQNFDETQIYYLTAADLGYPATDLVGLIPVTMTASDITTTGVTLTVLRPSMSAIETKPLTGLVAGDFTVTNLDDDSDVPVTGSTETEPGVYEITYADVPGASEFEASAEKAGFAILPVEYSDPS